MNWPLMQDNITRQNLDVLIDYLKQDNPRLTNGNKVREFESLWSEWLGVKYSVFVNSGSSANLISMNIIKNIYGSGEIIVPTLTWVSDITSVIQCGFTPVFVDIDPLTLGMDINEVIKKITPTTRAIFITHILGLNALDNRLLDFLKQNPQIQLIEDMCEAHGATFDEQKLGTFGIMSNFSFYYSHTMSSIEGGMVCTDDKNIYEMARMLRSHGLVRESDDVNIKNYYTEKYPNVSPEFMFAYPAYNMRSTEINAILAIDQLKDLNNNIHKRNENFLLFLNNLDSNKFVTNLKTDGCSNYALILILKNKNDNLYKNIIKTLKENNIEYRQGLSGGGNQLRQPYILNTIGEHNLDEFQEVEHINNYSLYIGNYPCIEHNSILELCKLLNNC